MHMDDIQLFVKNEKELETLINTGMEFSIEKWTMLIMKSKKRETMKGIETAKSRKNQNTRRKGKF